MRMIQKVELAEISVSRNPLDKDINVGEKRERVVWRAWGD